MQKNKLCKKHCIASLNLRGLLELGKLLCFGENFRRSGKKHEFVENPKHIWGVNFIRNLIIVKFSKSNENQKDGTSNYNVTRADPDQSGLKWKGRYGNQIAETFYFK